MPLNIRSEIVNELAERLAARRQVNKTEAVRIALQNELRRLDEAVPLRDRVRPLQERVLSRPATTGLEGRQRVLRRAQRASSDVCRRLRHRRHSRS